MSQIRSNVLIISTGNTDASSALRATNSDGTTLINVIDNGNVGIGIVLPIARLHVTGSDLLSTSYALKIDNSSSVSLLNIKNDGTSQFGTGFKILSGGTSASVNGLFPIYGGYGGSFEAVSIGLTNDISIGGSLMLNHSDFSKIYSNGNYGIIYSSISGDLLHDFRGKMTITTSTAISTNFAFKVNNVSSNNIFNITETGNIGIGLLTVPNGGKFHIINSTSETYIARFESSTNNPVLHIKEDETVGIRISTPERHLDIRGDIQIRRVQDAYSLGTTIDSYSTYHQGSYWDGLAAQSVFIRQQLLVTSNTPTYKLNFTNHIGGIIGSFANNGDITFNGLSGAGTRLLNIDSTGKLTSGSLISSLLTGSGTTNYIPKWTPSGLVLGNSQIFDDGTNIGIGIIAPTSTLHVKGSGTTNITSTFKITNSTPTTLLSILDNGETIFQSILDGETSGIDNYSFTSTTGGVNTSYYSQTGLGSHIRFYENSVLKTTIDSYGGGNFVINNPARFSIKSSVSGKSLFVINTTTGYTAISKDYIDPTAQLHIWGSSAVSSDFALKVDNSAASPLLYVRNDGNVTLMDATIGRGSGQIAGNTVFGINALSSNTTGGGTAIGYYTLSGNTTGSSNTAIGDNAMRYNTTGYENTAIGSAALIGNSIGILNVAIGSEAVRNNTSGSVNIGIGKQALYNNTTANCNIGIGNRSLLNNVTGALNIAIGGDATLFTNLGSNNVGLGYFAGQASNGSYNLFLGTYAGAYQGVVSNMLVIDNSNGRTNTATELTNALITGTFAVAPANQYLRFNANVGIGVDATARLHVQGIDSLSTNYALKADNSSLSPLLYVRNDGNVGIGTETPSAKLEVYGSANNYARLGSQYSTIRESASAFLQFGFNYNEDFYLYAKGIFLSNPTTNKSINNTNSGDIGVSYNYNFSDYSFKSYDSLGVNYFEINHIGYYGQNRLGVNVTPTATIHAKGVDSTSSNFALKVDNSSNTPLLYVRNDGSVGVGGTSIYSNYKLQIIISSANDGLQIIGGGVGSALLTTDSDGSSGTLKLYNSALGSNAVVFNNNSNSYIITPYNFGVGISSPTAKLHVQGSTNVGEFVIKMTDGYGTNVMKADVGGSIYFSQSNGPNVNIGDSTLAPTAVLEIQKSSLNNNQFLGFTNTQTGYRYFFGINATTNSFRLYDSTASSDRLILDTVGQFGLGVVPINAKLHVQGIDSTSSNYALKVDNSALSTLLYVRNDGNVGVGVSPTSNKFTIQDITSSNSQLVITSGGGATSFLAYSAGNQQLYFDAIYYGGSGGVIAQHTSASGIIWVSGQLRFCGNSGLTVGSIFSYNTLLNIDVSSGNLGIGIGTSSGLARLHVVGVSSTSSDYAMKVDNSISPLLYVRNDGNIGYNGTSFGGGVGVLFKGFAATVPTTNPTGGVIDYVENTGSGVQKYRDANGTIIAY